MKKILVIEDNENHLADAKEFFSSIEAEFHFASSLLDVVNMDGKDREYVTAWKNEIPTALKQFDGVITDFHFPEGGRANGSHDASHPIGLMIMLTAFFCEVPVIGITDQNHHADHMQWFTSFYRACSDESTNRLMDDVYWLKDGSKDWKSAWERLCSRMSAAQ